MLLTSAFCMPDMSIPTPFYSKGLKEGHESFVSYNTIGLPLEGQPR
jgi:hypothetical protein